MAAFQLYGQHQISGTKGEGTYNSNRQGDSETVSIDAWRNQGAIMRCNTNVFQRLQNREPIFLVQSLCKSPVSYVVKRESAAMKLSSPEKIALTQRESTPTGTSDVEFKGVNVVPYTDSVRVQIESVKKDDKNTESFSTYTTGTDSGYGRYEVNDDGQGGLLLTKTPGGAIKDEPTAVSVINNSRAFIGDIWVNVKCGEHFVAKRQYTANERLFVIRVPFHYEFWVTSCDKANYEYIGSQPIKFHPNQQDIVIGENENGLITAWANDRLLKRFQIY